MQFLLIIKILGEFEIRKNVFNLIKSIYKNICIWHYTDEEALNQEQGQDVLPLLFNTVLMVLANTVRQMNKKNLTHMEKGEKNHLYFSIYILSI